MQRENHELVNKRINLENMLRNTNQTLGTMSAGSGNAAQNYPISDHRRTNDKKPKKYTNVKQLGGDSESDKKSYRDVDYLIPDQ